MLESPFHLKLLEGSTEKAKYTCLSHQWGIECLPLRLLESNRAQFKEGIPESELPVLFR
jgi:hypothetical protein